MTIKKQLDLLKQNDLYSFILFALYNTTKLPEYSALSQLIYTIDIDSFLKLCNIFGGQTIYIPTLDEMEKLIYGLTLYQLVDLEHIDFNKALANINFKSNDSIIVQKDIIQCYNQIKNLLNQYSVGQ